MDGMDFKEVMICIAMEEPLKDGETGNIRET